MKRLAPWLAVALVFVVTGCKESGSESTNSGSGASQATGGSASASAAGGSGGGSSSSAGASSATLSAAAKSDAPAAVGPAVTTPSGLTYQDLAIGTGAEATPGHTVRVHYTGWLLDGTKVDSSLDRGQPIEFPLGTPDIIRGWNEGLTGMKVGGKRRLTIPPDLGYGAGGRPPRVPPNATLTFEVELVGVD